MTPDTSALKNLRIERPPETGGGKWAWILLLVIVIAGGAAAGYWWMNQSKLVEVRVAVAREGGTTEGGAPVERTVLNASGYVTARREATVSSKITGKVIDVLVEEGMRVTENQVLAHLDASNVSASLALAEAQLTSTRALLEETTVRIQEAEKELRREADLVAKKVNTQSDYDRAQAAYLALKAKLHQQEADVKVAQRQIDSWKQQLEDTIIRAPFAGIVTSKNAQPGEMISPMSSGGFTRTGICTIVDMDSLEIEIDVNESYINRVQAGQPVDATLDAYPDWKIPCKVIAIIPTADRQKSTVKVRVGFDKLDSRVLPEMSVKVAFREAPAADRKTTSTTSQDGKSTGPAAARPVILPASALVSENDRDILFVESDGRAERRAVTVAQRNDDEVVLQAGARAGERVILQPPAGLADGDRVRVAEE